MEKDYKKRLSELIFGSSTIDDEKKLLWNVFIRKSTDDESEAVYEAVSESSENLLLLTTYLADKISQMKAESN